MPTAPAILIICTSHGQMGLTTRRTGLWLEELSTPYYIFKDAGAKVTVASISGGTIPLDPRSESIIAATSSTKKFSRDAEATALLTNAIPIDSLNAIGFDAVLLAGGHGAMWDFTGNHTLKQLLEDFNRQHKVIGAVCHGAAALLDVLDTHGELLVTGRKMTAFSNSEEEAMVLTPILPFLLESELTAKGASYSKAALYTSHTIIDGNLITGQNPSSSSEIAAKILLAAQRIVNSPLYTMANPAATTSPA